MTPIEQIPHGALVFLKCGCAARRGLTHPTGAAALVVIQKACEAHASNAERVLALLKGELVSPFAKQPIENMGDGRSIDCNHRH